MDASHQNQMNMHNHVRHRLPSLYYNLFSLLSPIVNLLYISLALVGKTDRLDFDTTPQDLSVCENSNQ